ncbi:MAG: ArnT family glycosyltransferase [Gemmatimonadaceae bacterium]
MSERESPQIPDPETSVPIGTLEIAVLALATVTGLALRGWHLGDAGLTHFDEGVYAFTGLGVADPSQPSRFFPDQQKFSPPVYFLLVALSNVLGVSPERSPFLVNVAMGTLTIPVLWVLTRRWFGPVAAAGTAWLVAMSEFHILMSRTALTDVTFALAFFLALGGVLAAIEHGTRRSAVLAGLLVGLAWNTKYHGWFALVIAAMVIAARGTLQHADRAWVRRAVRRWLLMCVVAAVCYVPWSLFIQSQSGASSGWASYFATMLRLDWVGNLWRQIQQQAYLEGPWSRTSVPLAALAAQLVAARHGRTFPVWLVPALGVAALLVGGSGSALLLTAVALWQAWRRGMSGADWLLASLVLLWLVMAPIYHPYFRLILPFSLATCVLAGAAFRSRVPIGPFARVPVRMLAPGAAGTVVVATLSMRLSDPSSPWRPTRSLPDAAAAMDAALPAGTPVSVIGEPALAFYLHQRGHASFERTTMEALDTLGQPRYVVAGIYLRRAPLVRERFESRRERLELLGRFPLGAPSDLRLLDDFRPDSARRWVTRRDSTYDLLLFRYTPPRAGEP